jgi:hypothetical protein
VHIWDVDLTLFAIQRKLILTIECLFVLGTGLVKISILLFFRRLGSRGSSKAFRITTWVAIGLQAASTVAFFISPLVGCNPLSAYWEQSDITNIALGIKFNCNDEGIAITVSGVLSTVQDLICALLPNFIYWNAKIPFRQKMALMGIFATAYGVAIFGALRTHATWVLFYQTYDVSWQLWEIWNWTLLEIHIGVICANAPALKVFVSRYLNIKSIGSGHKDDSSNAKPPKTSTKSSKSSSQPSGGPKGRIAAWKNSFANHGYFTQPTRLSDDTLSGVLISEDWDDGKSDDKHTSVDSSPIERPNNREDVELGIVPISTSHLCPPPQIHRASYGQMSVYLYDDQHEGVSSNDGLRYMRVKM